MNTRMAIILVLVLVTLACTGRSRPAFEPLLTPTTPPDFVSYSDELNIFSIEYPLALTCRFGGINLVLTRLSKWGIPGKLPMAFEDTHHGTLL